MFEAYTLVFTIKTCDFEDNREDAYGGNLHSSLMAGCQTPLQSRCAMILFYIFLPVDLSVVKNLFCTSKTVVLFLFIPFSHSSSCPHNSFPFASHLFRSNQSAGIILRTMPSTAKLACQQELLCVFLILFGGE